MTYYFGFLPSDKLNATIDKAYELIQSNSSERYDVYRDNIVHLISQELLSAMLFELIAILPDDSERKTHLVKAAHTIESTLDKLINTLLTPTKNDEVLKSFEFFDQALLITDNMGKRRISVALDDQLAQDLLAIFEQIKQGNGVSQADKLITTFNNLAQACVSHFLVDFSKTLPLNILKRGAIPVAESVIDKVLSVAVHRLIPQMPQESLERFREHYEPMVFQAKT